LLETLAGFVLWIFSDGNKEVEEEYESKPRKSATCDFDELLRQAQAKIKKS